MKHYEMLETCFSITKEIEVEDYVSIGDEYYVRHQDGRWEVLSVGSDATTMIPGDSLSTEAITMLEGLYEDYLVTKSLYDYDVPDDLQ